MFAVRFVILALLVAYGWAMGKESSLNAFGSFMVFTLIVTAPALYMLPTYEAAKRKHPSVGAIGALNFFLGWTVVGWVSALVWAFKNAEPVVDVTQTQTATEAVPAPDVRKCPFCAEDVKAAAIKCKHCGSDLPPIESPATA